MPSHTIDRILATLNAKRENVTARAGVRMCMTAEAIGKEIGLSRPAVIAAIYRCRQRFTAARKKIYIAGWERKVGVSGDAAALWGIGNYPDKKPPKTDRLANEARYRQKCRMRIKSSPVPTNSWLHILSATSKGEEK